MFYIDMAARRSLFNFVQSVVQKTPIPVQEPARSNLVNGTVDVHLKYIVRRVFIGEFN